MKKIRILVLVCLLVLLFACGRSAGNNGTDAVPDKYLPIGSVVLLHGGNQPLMIYARAVYFDSGETRDYMSVLYPFGYITDDEVYSFDHDEIERVLFMGYETEDEQKVNEYLLENAR